MQGGFERDTFAKAMFDSGYVQASDREDTGKASGTRAGLQVHEPRANARRLMNSVAGIIHQPERVSVRLSAN